MNAETASGLDRPKQAFNGPSAIAGATLAARAWAFFGLAKSLRPREAASVALFFTYAFLLLVCYYILKTVREPLLLDGGSAELKSYAGAAIAAVLLVLVPLYGVVFRRTDRRRLVSAITAVFIATLIAFYVLGRAGFHIGFAYYVWAGVFGVVIVAQFWAHAAHTYNTESGQRLFPVVMAGAALGGLAGPPLSRVLFPLLGPWNLLLIAAAVLLATLPLVDRSARAVPPESRHRPLAAGEPRRALGGLSLVLGDRYLLLLAVLAVILNCVNSTGEYILTQFVLDHTKQLLAADPSLDKKALIAAFYGDFYFVVNAATLLLQVALVGRVFRWLGVQRAILIAPIVALIGYGLIAFLPVFSMVRAVKILENSVDYSIMNTARHALYLPLPAAHQYEGKTAVDAFFWRFGDVLQAGVIYVGLKWLGFDTHSFALLNGVFAALWIAVTLQIRGRAAIATRRAPIRWRRALVGACSTAFALVAFAVPDSVRAEPSSLFDSHEPLAIELVLDARGFCRRDDCSKTPAEVVYKTADGAERRLSVALRVRGQWRADGSHCTVPPLFVYFDAANTDEIFGGQGMLPLTTHCREQKSYEDYVLKEYVAYRIYNLLTDGSLRVRLVRVAYRQAGGRARTVERYAFFTEHFRSLAARRGAEQFDTDHFQAAEAEPRELATLELFEYLIGNTDWSATHGHNITFIREADGLVTAVPFDFDFSGLVNAEYAGPPPQLPIRSVTQRLFRGFCRAGFDWQALIDEFTARHEEIVGLVDEVPTLTPVSRKRAEEFLQGFFEVVRSPRRVQDLIVGACRSAI